MGRSQETKKTSPIPIRLPNDWIKKLKLIATHDGISSYAEIIRIAVKSYIDDYEDHLLGLLMEEVEDDDVINADDFTI